MSILDSEEEQAKFLEGMVSHKGENCNLTGRICQIKTGCNGCWVRRQWDTVLENAQSNREQWKIQ